MRKKLITMGLVSALGASTSAMAADLDATTVTPQTYATDTATTGVTNTDGTIDLALASVVTDTALGFGVAGGNQTYVRFDITGAEFEGAVVTTDFNVSSGAITQGINTSVAQGGADEGTFVIFDVTSNTAAPMTQGSNVDFTPVVSSAASGSAGVTMAVYDTPADASNQTNPLYSISGTWAAFTQGLTVPNTASSETAEVTTTFTLFADGATTTNTGALGNFAMTLDTTALDVATGAVLTNDATATGLQLVTDAPNAALTLNGDVSFGDWFIDVDGDDCNAGANSTDLVEDTDTFDNATANAGAMVAGTYYNLCVTVDGTETINAGDYSMDLAWETGTRTLPASDSTVAVGSIARNGTTKYIPYLSTFEDYNQRLVIVNRGSTDANYSLTFTSEDGVTATAGSAATGVAPAGEVLSIKASDIVTLAGKTRTAATLVVVAPSGNIDVATNQVNLSDGSTDTVVY